MTRLAILWVHVLMAAVWVGGLVYATHLVLPAVGRGNPLGLTLLRRARLTAWVAVVLLVLTGLENLRHARLDSPWLIAKVLLVLVLVPLAAHRDFALLPRAARAIEAGQAPRQAMSAVRGVDRGITLAAVVVLLLGVAVARGR